MRINVSQLLKEETGATRRHQLSEAIEGVDHDLDLRAPVEGEVRLIRTDRGILVQATLSTTWGLSCGRCLDRIERPVSAKFEEEYEPRSDGVVRQQERDEPVSGIDGRHILDLTEDVRQAFLLEMPISPICRQDCAGLCPICGLNLNDHPTHRHEKPVDPRWSVLQDLLSGTG